MTRLPCQFASIDVSDVLGVRKVNMTKNIRKWKVSAEGKEKNRGNARCGGCP